MTTTDAKPILFSSPMIRALLAGTKTQTRRIVKTQPTEHHWAGLPGYSLKAHLVAADKSHVRFGHVCDVAGGGRHFDIDALVKCPYGGVGGRLWVRETWGSIRNNDDMKPSDIPAGSAIGYKTDDIGRWCQTGCGGAAGKWRPSIYMPRWASRITLTLTDVRVQRVQDISLHDAKAEGGFTAVEQFAGCYAETWEAINGPGSWAANQWVWALTFTTEVRK